MSMWIEEKNKNKTLSILDIVQVWKVFSNLKNLENMEKLVLLNLVLFGLVNCGIYSQSNNSCQGLKISESQYN
jgi:hypothetical protein